MRKQLPNLLGAVVRDYFTDHLRVFVEPARTLCMVTAIALYSFYGFSLRVTSGL